MIEVEEKILIKDLKKNIERAKLLNKGRDLNDPFLFFTSTAILSMKKVLFDNNENNVSYEPC